MTELSILPNVNDRETAPFFAAAREHRLVIKQCRNCGKGIQPPTAHCPFCDSWDTHWQESKGTGTLYSWSVVEHQVHPACPVPYTLVVVTLDDITHVRLVGSIPGRPELKAGMPMRVTFQVLAAEIVVPQWEPVP